MQRGVLPVLLLLVGSSASAQITNQSLVQVRVDNSYSAEWSVQQIAEFATILPPRLVNVAKDDTLPGLVSTYYNFGASQSASAYSRMATAIRDLNGLQEDEPIPIGEFLIPSLPPFGWVRNGPAASIEYRLREIPQDIRKRLLRRGARDCRYVADVSAGAFHNEENTLIHIHVSTDDLATPEGEEFLSKEYVQLVSSPVHIRFAAAGDPGQDPVADAAAQLSRKLSTLQAKRKETRLFVLDSGWPPDEYEASFDALKEMIAEVGKDYGITPTALKQKSVGNPTQTHVLDIRAAIESLRQADPGRLVKVIYVPLTRDQSATSLLHDLVWVSLAKQRADGFAAAERVELSHPRIRNLVKHASVEAGAIVRSLSADAANQGALADQAVLSALGIVATADAEKNPSRGYFVINESWTLDEGSTLVAPIADQRGVVVAAAGNDGRDDIYARPTVNYAGQSYRYGDIVTALNLASDGSRVCCAQDPEGKPTYCSSLVPPQFVERPVAGFDGRTATACGTSISAPRIAFLIALGEAFRDGDDEPAAWTQRLAVALRTARVRPNRDFLLEPAEFVSVLAHGFRTDYR